MEANVPQTQPAYLFNKFENKWAANAAAVAVVIAAATGTAAVAAGIISIMVIGYFVVKLSVGIASVALNKYTFYNKINIKSLYKDTPHHNQQQTKFVHISCFNCFFVVVAVVWLFCFSFQFKNDVPNELQLF